MLQKLNNFEELCLTFKWNIPEFYNIASDTIDQDIYQNRIALINSLQDGKIEEWSFVDIKRSANKLANVFDHFHLEANARVGIILGQCPETAIAHMACFKSGKISIPLFNLFGTDALHYRLLNSRASLVICDNIGLNKIFEIKDRLPDLKKIICIDSNDEKRNVFNFKKLLEHASDSYITKKTKASDPALIIYTSGTTGGPKGALLPHRSLLGHIPGVEIPHEFLSSSEPVTDLFWTPADWAWIGGLFDVLLPAWHFGIPVVSYRSQKFDPEVTFDLISKLEIKNTFLPPTALKMMKSFNPSKTVKNLKLRTVGSGGEALGEDLLEWGKKILGVGIGSAITSTTDGGQGNIASQQQLDMAVPDPEFCRQWGASAFVIDVEMYTTLNPSTSFVTQPALQPGCVIRRENWTVLQKQGAISNEDVRECKQRMNTFAYIGSIRDKPIVKCVYQTDVNENKFIIKGDGQAEDGGVGINKEAVQF